jgi:hypothetical protein
MANLSAAELPASSEEDEDGARVLGVGRSKALSVRDILSTPIS